MRKFGIDISVWNKNMNISKAKAEGVEFVIIRGAYGNKKDTAYENNYNKCKSLGLPVGVYWWTRAVNEAQASEEAIALINNCLKGKQFEYPIYIDVEDKLLANLGKSKVDAIITSALITLEKNGYYAGFYMNKDWYNNKCNGANLAKRFASWIAQWTSQNQTYPMWQFGGETNKIRSNIVAGEVCDQDYCHVDYPSEIKKAGLNGFSKGTTPTSQPAPQPTPSKSFLPSRGYIKPGDKSENISKIATFMRKTFPSYTPKQALGPVYGPYLQKAIKEFQRRTGLEPDGCCGPKTLAKLVQYGFRY